MVRLKENKLLESNNTTAISIPYGAIKRYNHFRSLPATKKFQFLMVRLKVLEKLTKKSLNYISIPYGAIKSLTASLSKLSLSYFNSLWCD